jgi:hypothetical protein
MNFLKKKNVFWEQKSNKSDVNDPEFRAKILLEWLIGNGELPEDATLDDISEESSYYQMDSFDVDGIGYAIGTDDETNDSCYEYLEDLIKTEGINFFNKEFLKSHIDTKMVIDYADDYFRHDVYDSPESYFEPNQRNLSHKQIEQVEILQMRKERLENGIQKFENIMGGENNEWMLSKIYEFNELIEEYELEIEDIESDPDGEFPDELIEDQISNLLRDVERRPISFLDEYGFEYYEFIDKDSLMEDVIESDGYGQLLGRYDGEAHEVMENGELFYIIRID